MANISNFVCGRCDDLGVIDEINGNEKYIKPCKCCMYGLLSRIRHEIKTLTNNLKEIMEKKLKVLLEKDANGLAFVKKQIEEMNIQIEYQKLFYQLLNEKYIKNQPNKLPIDNYFDVPILVK